MNDKTCPICGLEHDGADYQRVRTVCSDALLLNAAKLLAGYAELSEYAHDAEHLAAQARQRADGAEAELRKLREQVRAANGEIDRLKALLAPAAQEAAEAYTDLSARIRQILNGCAKNDWVWDGKDERYSPYFDFDGAVAKLVTLVSAAQEAAE